MKYILCLLLLTCVAGCKTASTNSIEYDQYRAGGDQVYDEGSPFATRSDWKILGFYFTQTGHFWNSALQSASVRASVANFAAVPVSFTYSIVGNQWSYEGGTVTLEPGQVLDLGVVTDSFYSWYSDCEVYIIGPVAYLVSNA